MVYPMDRPIEMAKHDRRCRPEAGRMRRFHHREPLFRVDLVGAEHRAYLIIENFGRRSGQSAEPSLAQRTEKHRHIETQRRSSLPDFEWRKGMHMYLRYRLLGCAADRQVTGTRIGRMDTPLHADLGPPALPGLAPPPFYLGERQVIGTPAQILAQLAF